MRGNILKSKKVMAVATVGDMRRVEKMIAKTRRGEALSEKELKDVFGSGDEFAENAMLTYARLYGEAEARGDVENVRKPIFAKRSKSALDMIPDRPRTNFGRPKEDANLIPLDHRFMDILTDIMSRENGIQLDSASVARKMRSAYGIGKLTEDELVKLLGSVAPRAKDKQALVEEIKKRHSGQRVEPRVQSEPVVEKKPKNDQTYKKDYADLSLTERRTVNKIIELRLKGVTLQEIADILGISTASVSFKWNQYSKGLTGKY
jgi:uncharacterized protein YkvS